MTHYTNNTENKIHTDQKIAHDLKVAADVPARKSANCYIENYTANSEKTLLDLPANQLKWQLRGAVASIGSIWIPAL